MGQCKFIPVQNKLEIEELVQGEQLVIFVGSGISLWAPTNLPSGEVFTNDISDPIFNSGFVMSPRGVDPVLETIVQSLPFEVLNDLCPERPKLRRLLKNKFSVQRPNSIHHLLAQLLFEKKISSVITPNYDCSLDLAIARNSNLIGPTMNDIKRVVFETDTKGIDLKATPIYFKIHGSTDDDSEESLVFMLSQESRLEQWKVDCLHELIQGNVLLIIGYSGRDFDICPELRFTEPNRILWNLKESNANEDDLLPSQQETAKHVETEFLCGDMRALLDSLFGAYSTRAGRLAIELAPGSSGANLKHQMTTNFDQTTRWFWGIRALNSMNYNRRTLAEIDAFFKSKQADTELSREVRAQYGAALASSGKYKKAALAHLEASDSAFRNQDKLSGNSNLLGASDAWRCSGSFIKAIETHLRVKTAVGKDPDLESLIPDVNRNEILLLKHLYLGLKLIKLFPLAKRVQKRAKDLIAQTIEFYRERGAWYPLQQLGLWNEKFDLPTDNTKYRSRLEIPGSLAGYQQLNFLMGQMMAFRHNVKNGKLVDNQRTGERALVLAKRAKDLGIAPEVWKLNLLIYRHLKSVRKWENLRLFWLFFWQCEYAAWFRIWRLILED